MRIGITEQGDAGLDFMWFNKLASGTYEGAVLITKNPNDAFITKVIQLYNDVNFKNIIIHVSCTGMGKTVIEPQVPDYKTQLQGITKLLQRGFPTNHIVLRIDPIIPTNGGLGLVKHVLDDFLMLNTGITRVRFSILDQYQHVRNRFIEKGIEPPWNGFYAPKWMQENLDRLFSEYSMLQFESCAEDYFVKHSKNENIISCGCISSYEIELFDLKLDAVMFENNQNRHGCHCYSCKTELLNHKCRCPHQCLYCYWKDPIWK